MFFNYEKSTFVLPFCIGCHVNRLLRLKPTIAAWLFVRHLKWCPIVSIQSRFNTSHFTSIGSRCDTHLKSIRWMQTEVNIQYKTLRYLQSEIVIEFPGLELTSDTGLFVPLWGESDFPSNRAGFREKVHRIQLAEKVLRQTWYFSFWDDILSTFTAVFRLAHFCYEQLQLKCIKLISVCVESALWCVSK